MNLIQAKKIRSYFLTTITCFVKALVIAKDDFYNIYAGRECVN